MVAINNSQNSFVLSALRQTNKDIAISQTRIGTGFKINSAADNAGLWGTVTKLRSEIKTADTTTANISLSKGRADAAINGFNKINDLLTKMQEVSDATDAAATGSELDSAVNKIASYQKQITAIAKASTFSGKNFITGAGTEDVVIGTDSTPAPVKVSLTYVDATVSVTSPTSLGAAIVGSTTNVANVKLIAGLAVTAKTYIQGIQADISAFSEGLEFQLDFQSSLKSIKESALSGLVDTDMEAEAAKITALQTKQQLAYQALAITNASSQNVLMLFR